MKTRRRPLGYYDLRRFAVTGCTEKRIYTSVVDALSAARHINKTSNKTCHVLHGMPGAEAKIASCAERRCRTPGGEAISMRKLYEAEQQGSGYQPKKSSHGKRGKGERNVPAKIKSDRKRRGKAKNWSLLAVTKPKRRAKYSWALTPGTDTKRRVVSATSKKKKKAK